jgi:hypothetical protein
MQKTNPVLKQAILEVVNNQIEGHEPPETKQTYDRLIARGYLDPEARDLIGYVVSTEIFDVLKRNQPFNPQRFIRALNNLPEL